uniref:Uncharacterized protein n=1 Tax=uncultured Nocardioidaceae bacterium TaxID=253824 RepID=A0A6J4M267_9ACTN|nr:MAG: hypothetical protein AVDCRST_MAG46-2382 [uncultured Nocardioidaceae bacterium]
MLIGAALNASFDRVFPESSTAGARLELVRRLRERSVQLRMRESGLADGPSEVAADRDDELIARELEEQTHRIVEDARRRRGAV